jgi:Ser/Thr protein kinase RdoA (MazF antagonist)
VSEPMRHSYTNQTTKQDLVVTKAYQGPDAMLRCEREAILLRRLAGRLPVPAVISEAGLTLELDFMPGVHGQDLIAAGLADQVLRACGLVLRRIQHTDPRSAGVPGPYGAGRVLVHGDFGPNNALLDSAGREVVGLLDWEWAHAGDPVEDLAWCEWIVRTHHPGDVGSLGQLFTGYGDRPPWRARQHAMIARCRELLDFCKQWQRNAESVRVWERRAAAAEAWTECP